MATRLWRPSRLSPPQRLDPPWRTSPPPSPNFDLDTHKQSHTHKQIKRHTLLPLNAWSVFVCRDNRTGTSGQFGDKWTSIESDAGSCLEELLGSVVDDGVHQKCNVCIHKWSSLKKRIKNALLQHHVMPCVGSSTYPFPLLWGENITSSCSLEPGTSLLPCLSAKAHTRQNVI